MQAARITLKDNVVGISGQICLGVVDHGNSIHPVGVISSLDIRMDKPIFTGANFWRPITKVVSVVHMTVFACRNIGYERDVAQLQVVLNF